VLESRAVHAPGREGHEALLVPAGTEQLTVCASAFNRLRQRSDLVTVAVEATAVADDPRAGAALSGA
jgi:hypothetical protein